MNYWTLLRQQSRKLGYGYTHYFFSSLGQTFFISVFVESFSAELGMQNQGFSVLYAAATIASSLTLPFIGSVLDKVKLRNFSLANGILLALFCLVVSLSQNRVMLLFGLYGLRLSGQGLMALIGSAAIARNFKVQRGKALSIAVLGLSTGETIMPVVGVSLIGLLGWSQAWQVLAIFTLLVFIPVVAFLVPKSSSFHIPPLKQKENVSQINDKSRKQVMREGRFYVLVANTVFTPFFITGMFIHHNLLAQIKGWEMSWIATCFIGYGITKTISSLVAGPVVDRLTARAVFPFYLIPMALGALILIVAGNSPWVALVYLCFLAMSVALMSVTSTALWVELYGHTHFGAIKSMVTTMVVFASAIGPLVIGMFMEQHDIWKTGLFCCVGLIFVLVTANYFVLRKKD